MKRQVSRLRMVYTTGLAPLLLLVANSPCQAQTTAASPSQVKVLIRDINAYMKRCESVRPSHADLFQACATEKKSLLARQMKLGVSNETINGTSTLNTRGWRGWPG
jgi:hypothetical protein